MLTGAGLGDDSVLSHSPRQQYLSQRVVDLVGSRMTEVFPLQINPGSAEVLCQPAGVEQRRGPPDEMSQQMIQLALEGFVLLGGFISGGQFFERLHQCFGNKAPAVFAKVAA